MFLVSCAYATGTILLESSADSVGVGHDVTFSAIIGETMGYLSADLGVSYDPDYFIYKSYSLTGTASDGFTAEVSDNSGVIDVSMYGDWNSIGAEGDSIIKFKFEAKEVTENTDTIVSITSATIGTVSGGNEMDTLGSKTITILGLPDLIVSDIVLKHLDDTLVSPSEEVFSEGDTIKIAPTIKNIGGTDVDRTGLTLDTFRTSVYDSIGSDNLLSSDEIDMTHYDEPKLSADGEIPFSAYSWKLPTDLVDASCVDGSLDEDACKVDICVWVDSSQVVVESTEADSDGAGFIKSIFNGAEQNSNIECVKLTVANLEVCGDGVKEGTEACDDGNKVTETTCDVRDGACTSCNAYCTVQHIIYGPKCGDGTMDVGYETCDDGNEVSGDGCSETCQVEVADPICNDGIVNGDDECDNLALAGESCTSREYAGKEYDAGTLGCNADCTFDVSGCEEYECNLDIDCTDSDVCTVGETCGETDHMCHAGTPLVCDDGIDCTVDVCDAIDGCVIDSLDHMECDDGIPCTDDICNEHFGCTNPSNVANPCACPLETDAECEDGNPCTTDSCGADLTCSNDFVVDGTSCDDTLSCTDNDMCSAEGVCRGTPTEDDGVDCTVDSCTETDGPQNTPDASSCIDDGDSGTKTVCSLSEGCINEPVTLCLDDDNFCPSGCNALISDANYDADCPMVCGNSKIELSGDHIIFVSTTSTSGAIEYEGITGISAADAICQADAEVGGLDGTFVALLSTSTEDAKDRINDAVFYNVKGQLVADSKADLFDNNIDAKVYDLSEQVGTAVKTASLADGTFHEDYTDCNGWTYLGDDEDLLLGVNSKLDRDWFGYNSYDDCSRVIPVYCVQDVLGEACDDGNDESGDGCSSTCQLESLTVVICGDGTKDPTEQCDDGNEVSGDGCSSTCQTEITLPVCGDGVKEGTEACDDGDSTDTNACKNDCTINADYVIGVDPEPTPTPTPTPAPSSGSSGSSGGGGGTVFTRYTTHFQCDDKTDNDGDGKIDLADPDCSSSVDDSEKKTYRPAPAKPKSVISQALQAKEPVKKVVKQEPKNICGNGNCEVTETAESCPTDCKTVSFTWLVILLAAIGGGGVIYMKRDELSTFSFDDISAGFSLDEVKDKLREIIPKKSEDLSFDKPTTLPISPIQNPKSISQRPLSVLPRKIRVQPMLPAQQSSPRMIAYIRSVRVRGYTDAEIRSMLLKYNWSTQKIDQALRSA
jgi:cysteine-rich repeat protein